MGQIVGSNISATAAMFALWIGVLGVLAVFPYCSGSAETDARRTYDNAHVELVLPS
jgi:hypothetical protein